MSAPDDLARAVDIDLPSGPRQLPSLAPAEPSVPRWAGPVVAAGLGLAWLVLRPGSPHGAVAVVDLLALPAVLFGIVRLLAGRTSMPAAELLVLFGLGAVFAPVTSLLVEATAAPLLNPTGERAVGSLVEVLAPVVPVMAVAALLLREGRRPTMADLALAGLASGLGFLVLQSSLVTAASHEAPRYVTPLVAGWQRVDGPAGVGTATYVGPAAATALIGLGLGAGIRWGSQWWRLVPPVLAVCLLVLDRGGFDRELRYALTADAPLSRLVELLQPATAFGALALVLLVVGLILARVDRERPWAGWRRPASPAGDDVDGGGQAGPADDGAGPIQPPPAEAGDVAVEPPGDDPGGISAGSVAVACLTAVAAGVLFVVLARTRHLGFLQDRPVALAVSVAGFGYSLLRLANLRYRGASAPVEEVEEPSDEELAANPASEQPDADASGQTDPPTANDPRGSELLCLVAVVASALGIVSSLLPSPVADRPVHGALTLEVIEGWAAHVGHRGLLLGLAGLAAPPGPLAPRSGGGWADVLPWRIHSSGWWAALLGPGTGRLGWGAFWRVALQGVGGDARRGRERGRLPWLSGKWRPVPLPPEPEEEPPPLTTTITISPIDESSQLRAEFEGATVQEAMQAALRHVGLGLSSTSLHLVDEGLPPKPGKPGSGRPARVRVVRSRDDADPLLPPGRDSIRRTSWLIVVVEIVDPARAAPPRAGAVEVVTAPDAGPPQTVNLILSCTARPAEALTLSCSREEMSPGRTRYRSNPYSVDAGEDPAWVAATATPAGAIRVSDGEQLRVGYGDQEALVTVYDDWARQVVGVNRGLLDLTAAHHVTTPVTLEQEAPGAGRSQVIERLRDGLAAIEEARRLLGSEAPDDEKAFIGTALLHGAMCIDRGDGLGAVIEAAATALAEHRREAVAGRRDSGAYRRFLDSTVVGGLWASGEAAPEEVEALLGWGQCFH